MTRTSPARPSYRRSDVLRAVLACSDERLDATLPMDVPGVRETFGDETTLLAALQLRWHTRLAAYVEQALAGEPRDREAAVVAAWREAAEDLPGLRLVLDRCREEPVDNAMADAAARARSEEHVLLASSVRTSAAGGRAAALVGGRLEELARRARVDASAPPPVIGEPRTDTAAGPRDRASVLDRLRSLLPA